MSDSSLRATVPGPAGAGGANKLTAWLARAPAWLFSLYAVAMAFTTYFCMYSYRKPFAAASYEGLAAGSLELKSALVISQLMGYALSKFLGIKVNSEMPRHRRIWALILLIAWAEIALVIFAVVPSEAKIVAIFFNGVPLGMVWGLVFSFLEGRQTSEILGAGLSCSYIVASGAVKSVGKWLMTQHDIDQFWMPALTGLMFLPLFLLTAYGLHLLPHPSEQDVEVRVSRVPMHRRERRVFALRYWLGFAFLVFVYLFLTAYRDYRDNFAAELWDDMGYASAPEVFTISELPIAFSVMAVLSLLYLIKDNRLGMLGTFIIMITGSLLVFLSTLLYDLGMLSGMVYMILVGLGLYLAYVPYGCVLFDRMIAALGVVATSVFLIYVSDAVGYSGSVAVRLYKDLGQPDLSELDFFRQFSYATGISTTILFSLSGIYFMRRARHP
ncbi:MAG: DUF5690 family protein [Proteobacteria bacterium]|nr:DUF5690 family protein [Pseudomonadota bacterium]